MTGFILGTGLEAIVESPEPPGIEMAAPTTGVLVLPVAGAPGADGADGAEGPQGPPGSGAADWVTERPLGVQDAVNQTFTTTFDFAPGTTRLFLNGMRQTPVESYVESGPNELDLSFAPYPDEELVVDYIKA